MMREQWRERILLQNDIEITKKRSIVHDLSTTISNEKIVLQTHRRNVSSILHARWCKYQPCVYNL